MKKSTFIYLTLGILVVTAFIITNDAFAQSQGEDEIIRITNRVLDIVLGFFKSILDMIGDFLKDLIPFFGDDEVPAIIEETAK
jgi:hypothetical protein